MTINMFHLASWLFPKIFKARERVADAMLGYVRNGGHEGA